MIAILDNIRSLYNVGSIFRTADGAGVKKLYLCGITPTPIDKFGIKRQLLTKVSLGAENSVLWEHKKSMSALVNHLKREGFTIVALEQSPNSISFHEFPNLRLDSNKIALIVGTEVTGIDKKTLALADKVIEIPMRGKKESLNVSVAFGIAAYELLKPS